MERYRSTIKLLEEALRLMDDEGDHVAAAYIAQTVELIRWKAERC